MLPLVSIIIPIYNAENFIDRCLNSILNQSFKDYVVYMINDGSTDNTLNKLEYFSKNDSRFILINKENSGVSTTRNFGLNLVKTKYTVFIDSDDTIEKDYLKLMINESEINDFDITICDYNIIKNGINTTFNNSSSCKNTNDPNELISSMLEHKIWGVLWNKLIKTKVYRDNNISFIDGINMWEDLYFCVNILSNTKKVGHVKKPLYNYYIINTGLVNSKTTKHRIQQQSTIIDALSKIEYIKSNFKKELNYSKIYAKENYLMINECFDPVNWRSTLPIDSFEIMKTRNSRNSKIIAILANLKLDILIKILILLR